MTFPETHTRTLVRIWDGLDAFTPEVRDCCHRWVEFTRGDVVINDLDAFSVVAFCAKCYVQRCSNTALVEHDFHRCEQPIGHAKTTTVHKPEEHFYLLTFDTFAFSGGSG